MSKDKKPMTPDEAECVLMNMADLADSVPEAGKSFAESVMDRAQSILDSIRRTKAVTPAQDKALMNMYDGLGRWTANG